MFSRVAYIPELMIMILRETFMGRNAEHRGTTEGGDNATKSFKCVSP